MAVVLQILILGIGADNFSLLTETKQLNWTNLANFLALELVITQIYFAYFYRRHQRSPGKMLFKLDVTWMKPLTQTRIFYREVIGKTILAPLACMNVFFYCLNKQGRLVQDFLAGTVVESR